MLTPDDIQYAMETARLLREPDRRIDTFGDTKFEFQLMSELMDDTSQVRIRSGELEAMRPRLIKPEAYREIGLEGFDENARERLDAVIERMRSAGQSLAFLQYGFHFRRGHVHEEIVHEPLADVRARLLEDVRISGNPALAVIEGADDAWEVCLFKFAFEMILRSQNINAFDFKRRGLL
jgi:hypothetical protein